MLAGLVRPGRGTSAFRFPSLLTRLRTAESPREEPADDGVIVPFPAGAGRSAGVKAPVNEEPIKESCVLKETAGAGAAGSCAEFPFDPNGECWGRVAMKWLNTQSAIPPPDLMPCTLSKFQWM